MTKAVARSGGKHRENKSGMFNSLDLFIFTAYKNCGAYGINNSISSLLNKLSQIRKCNS